MEGLPSLAELDREIALKSLVDWVPYLSPRYLPPEHLRPFLSRIEEAVLGGKEIRAVVHAPPRHSKTESILHSIPWGLKHRPDWTFGYTSYNADITRSKSRISLDLARSAGIHLATDNLTEWRTPQRGGCLARGIGEGLGGYGLNCFPTGTLVATESGQVPIERLVRAPSPPRVWAFNHATGRAELRRILAGREMRSPRSLVEVMSGHGLKVRCTDDHRIWAAGAYRAAGDVQAGDPLLRLLPCNVPSAVRGASEAPAARVAPLSCLSHDPPPLGRDSISWVRAIGSSADPVFDIQVEGLSNFFANGVLVHNCAFVDDAVKDRLEAESARKREVKWDWFQNVLMTRIEPKGSVFVCMTRWHADDLSGRLIKMGWEYIRLPALNDAGEPLWPERWPKSALEQRRIDVGEYVWASLFQGVPRPRGGAVFGDPWGYAELPNPALPRRHGIGLDFAFTKKTSSDYSALVVMMSCEGYFYVLDVVRVQMRAPEFKEVIRAYRARYPTARLRWIAAGTEVGVADFVREAKLPIELVTAREDKFVRALGYAAAWNSGRVLVPEDSTAHRWVDEFLVEHAEFTGVNDAKDDQVDAAVAAHGVTGAPPPSYEAMPESTKPRM